MGFKSMFVRKKLSSTSSRSPSAVDGAEAAEIYTRSPSSNAEAQIDELRQVFERFDVNGDGKISSSELGAMITSLGQTATEEEIQRMIIEADKDGDGFISLEEFIRSTSKMSTRMRLSRASEAPSPCSTSTETDRFPRRSSTRF
uniref:EF-hand domain-containing protein n=1 Tax=Kalanchoe fedtschenkoi TaxID=63787 RepID=A0A7N0TGN9_KALFE